MNNTLRVMLFVGLAVSIALLGGCTDADLKKGRRYQQEGNFDQAIQHFRLALEKNPEDSSARYGLVETYAQQLIAENKENASPETIEGAMAELLPIAKPLMKDPNIKRYISLIYQNMARIYAEQEQHDKAAAAWAEVIKIEPSYAEGYHNLGVANVKTGSYEEAISHFQKAVELNPYFIKGYYALGNTFVHLNRDQEAREQYLKALEINPDDPEVRHNLAIVYSRIGDKEKAVKELEKIIEVEPGYAMAYSSLIGI